MLTNHDILRFTASNQESTIRLIKFIVNDIEKWWKRLRFSNGLSGQYEESDRVMNVLKYICVAVCATKIENNREKIENNKKSQ